MRRAGSMRRERSMLQLVEEAFVTLRYAPLNITLCYFLGTVPFVVGFVYFWADMAYDAYAAERLGPWSLVISALYIWMKTCQSRFVQQLYERVSDVPYAPAGPRRWVATAVNQTIVQTTALVVLPVSLFFIAPFAWAYAFYHNMAVLDDGNRTGLGEQARKAAKLANLDQRQNFLLIWILSPALVLMVATFYFLMMPVMMFAAPAWSQVSFLVYSSLLTVLLLPLSPFGVAVALNIGFAIVAMPFLLKMLLGVESVFTVSMSGILTPLFFVIVCAITYCCLDPLVKTAYVLRCFYGVSRDTGRDLRVALARQKPVRRNTRRGSAKTAALLLVAISLSSPLSAHAQVADESSDQDATSQSSSEEPPTLNASELDAALDSILQKRQYAWRAPREIQENEDSWLNRVMMTINRSLGDAWRSGIDFIKRLYDALLRRVESLSGQIGGSLSPAVVVLRVAIYALSVALFAVVLIFLWRTWRRRYARLTFTHSVTPVVPDLEDEGTMADALPESGWLAMARELVEKGELRLAMRAYFFVGLSRLSRAELVRIARYKSNQDYMREVNRIAHEKPQTAQRFSTAINIFEAIWYGHHGVDEDTVSEFASIQEGLLR